MVRQSDLSVAAIMPVYNRRTTVLDALDSIAEQSLPPAAVFIVDDGSTDGTGDAIEQWMNRRMLPFQVKLIRQSNQGPSAARNQACRAAKECELYAFLDSDDRWPPDYLQRLVPLLRDNPGAIAATCDRCDFFGDQVEQSIDLSDLEQGATQWMIHKWIGIVSCTVFRARAIQQVGGFLDTLKCGEDLECFFRVSLLGSWKHSPGAPVRIGWGTAKESHESENLSACEVTSTINTPSLLNQLIDECDEKLPVDEQTYAPIMFTHWVNGLIRMIEVQWTNEAKLAASQLTRWARRVKRSVPKREYRAIFAKSWRKASDRMRQLESGQLAMRCSSRSLRWQQHVYAYLQMIYLKACSAA